MDSKKLALLCRDLADNRKAENIMVLDVRKISTVTNGFNSELGANLVKAGRTIKDKSDFRSQYDPGNPNADKQGYVKLPNVDSLVEIMDMREAQRSYEADLSVMDASKTMLARTVDLLNK